MVSTPYLRLFPFLPPQSRTTPTPPLHCVEVTATVYQLCFTTAATKHILLPVTAAAASLLENYSPPPPGLKSTAKICFICDDILDLRERGDKEKGEDVREELCRFDQSNGRRTETAREGAAEAER
ncbi:hypothetical protein L195_g040305 [Trifolium pratense]|uniref:Uncharacterized protein n=1 Tax=Trifolium pratense TaxID=57577 RepID=A0A2K3M0D8_TRIPR|nr:hypothetical protein L195_g040305 [Trifolium pratense]